MDTEVTQDKGPEIFAGLFHFRFPAGAPVLFEIGACDGTDSMRLSKLFPEAMIYAFEPNPDTIDRVRATTASNAKIRVAPMAVSRDTGVVPFFKSTNNNPGCSSLLRSSGKYDIVEPMPQTQIMVPSIRLDHFMHMAGIEKVDALWLDAQGSELSILKSLGDKLSSVRGVWVEFFYDELYVGQPLLPELLEWLEAMGFIMTYRRDVLKDHTGKWWWGDAFFWNTKL